MVPAGGLGHVLHQVAAARDIHHLIAAADGEQRDAVAQRPAAQRQVERVLFLVDTVQRLVRRLAGPAR